MPPDALHRLSVQRASGGALPRGSGTGIQAESEMQALPSARDVSFVRARGPPSWRSAPCCNRPEQPPEALDATLVDMRFVKPMDEALVLSLAASHDQFVTLEDNAIMGGAGSAVNELLMGCKQCKPVLNLGRRTASSSRAPRMRSTPCWGWTAWAFRPASRAGCRPDKGQSNKRAPDGALFVIHAKPNLLTLSREGRQQGYKPLRNRDIEHS